MCGSDLPGLGSEIYYISYELDISWGFLQV